MGLSKQSHAVVVLALLIAGLALSASASAAPFASGAYHVRKAACARPRRASGAACEALRLLASAPLSAPSADGRAPRLRASKTSGPVPGSLTPAQLHAAYELPAETSVSGAQTIALVDAYKDPTIEGDLAVYDKQFGLPECTRSNGCLQTIDEDGNESPLPANEGGWAAEISIDVEMAHAICQDCHIVLVESDGEAFAELGAGVNAALAAGAGEISNSYGSLGSESSLAAREREENSEFYDHPGVAITASTGDCGYRDSNPEQFDECDGLAANVGFPAASPDVVAVGGTTLSEAEGDWQSTVWEGSGGGCSSIFPAHSWQSALGDWSQTSCGADRLSADVSAEADPDTGVAVYDSTPEFKGAETGWTVYGGTSVASPILAAEFALAGGAHGVSYPAQTLYAHLGEASALYDVSSGSNGTCAGALACEAASGYDGPSGVGSPLGLSAFAPGAGAPANLAPPTIGGTAQVGQTLHASPGSWTNSPTATIYQWEECRAGGSGCLPIEGANEPSYVLASTDAGEAIRVMETASNGAGFGPPALSAPTASVAAAPPAPTITALTPKKGEAGTRVTISGTGFVNVTSVDFGSQPAKGYEVDSEGEIAAEAPAGSGTVAVWVTTLSGVSTAKHENKAKFKYKKPRR